MATVKEYAEEYIKKGWQVVKLQPRDKKPIEDGWPDRIYTPDDFQDGHNIGVKLGIKSKNLVDVDIDDPEACSLAPYLLPYTEAVFGRPGKPSSHLLYYCENAKTLRQLGPDGKVIVELRVNGQTMAPPSIHPSGEVITWEREGEPAQVDYNTLKRAVKLLATATLLKPYWVEGNRQNLTLPLAGGLLRLGLSLDEVINLIRAIGLATGDNEIEKRIEAIKRTDYRLEQDIPTTGFKTIKENKWLPVEVIDAIYKILEVKEPDTLDTLDIRRLFVRASELKDLKITPPPNLISATINKNEVGIIPSVGLTMLAGRPKTGKSFLTLTWALLIANGENRNGFNVKKGNVCYLSFEDSRDLIQIRIAQLTNELFLEWPPNLILPEMEMRVLIGTLRTKRKKYSKIVEILEEVIKMENLNLLAIDPLAGISREKRNTDFYQADYDSLFILKELADKLKVAILLIHHLRKGANGLDWMDSILGTTALTGAVDTVIALERENDAGTLKAKGRYYPEIEVGLQFENGIWKVAGTAAEVKLRKERRKIFEAIKEMEEMGEKTTPKAIYEYLMRMFPNEKFNYNTVKNTLGKMAKGHELVNEGGEYHIPKELPF